MTKEYLKALAFVLVVTALVVGALQSIDAVASAAAERHRQVRDACEAKGGKLVRFYRNGREMCAKVQEVLL